MEEPPKKYFRLFPGNEVRLMQAYFVTCTGFEKDENGKVTVVHCTYDPETKSGCGFTGRKVKGTIHWVPAPYAVKAEVRLYENIIDEEKGVYNEDGSLNLNPNSLTVLKDCYIEPAHQRCQSLRQLPVCAPGLLLCGCQGFHPRGAGVQPDRIVEELLQAAESRIEKNRFRCDVRLRCRKSVKTETKTERNGL